MDRYLVLENGMTFKGAAFGADGEVTAEIVFTTAMTGYLETLTDKSYTGQAVVQTFPLIGNYGIIPEDAEGGRIGPSAYIVREWCENPSNFRCQKDLNSYLKEKNIPGLCGIDTRALTRILRERGVMNGKITSEPSLVDLNELKAFTIQAPVEKISLTAPRIDEPEKAVFTVALLDFGMKENIARSLVSRGCRVHMLPYNTPASEILALKPDGLFLTNGPGNPEDNTIPIATIKELLSHKLPTMGICLGHQLLALAHGFSTEKLKYGHRGANQPVRSHTDGKTYISSQNHGYAVVADSIDTNLAEPFFTNVNDGTNEGLLYKNIPAFSVQFHPEACGGPKDTDFLFDDFITLMKEGSLCR